ncbi:hypothetical protein OHW91_15115 [Acinetobacter baumannii]|nr:hypothetical protein [Acinetobacter baumannii]
MTDLNKLRSEFEAQHSDKVFKIVKFDEATNAYCLHAHLPLTEINLSALAEINYGWDLWQKAKAQAVPEGFKLVPVELYNFQANRLAEEEFKQNEKLFNMEHRGLSGTEVELRKLKWLQCKAESIKQNYRQLVKWASESGAGG